MKKELVGSEERAQQARKLLETVFVRPTRFRAELAKRGVKLAEGDPIGVATLASLQLELELKGMSREVRRPISTQAIRSLMQGDLTLFPLSNLSIISADHGPEPFFYRSDISEDRARARYDSYRDVLVEGVEILRLERESQRSGIQQKPISGAIMVSTTFFPDDPHTKRIDQLKKELGRGVDVEEMKVEFPNLDRLILSLLPREDVKRLLEQGIEADLLPDFLQNVRWAIMEETKVKEDELAKIALVILEKAEQKLMKTKKKLVIPVFAPRSIEEMLHSLLLRLNEDENLKIEGAFYHTIASDYPPYPYGLMDRWSSRLSLSTLEGLAAKSQKIEEGETELVRNLLAAKREEGGVLVDEKSFTTPEIDQNLSTLLLPNDLLLKAIFADMLGELLPMVFFLRGEQAETGLVSLRYLADQFSPLEIRDLLKPQEVDVDSSNKQAIEIRGQINDVHHRLRGIKGSGREISQRKAMLGDEIRALTMKLGKVVAEGKNRKSIRELIADALKARVPIGRLKPSDYTRGETSAGFLEAMRRYREVAKTNPDLLAPDPNNYKDGENSLGYKMDVDMYEAMTYGSPGGWFRNFPAHKKVNAPSQVPSLIRESLFK